MMCVCLHVCVHWQLAKARLHTAMLHSKMRNHRESLKYLEQVSARV